MLLRPKVLNCLKESVKKDPNYADAWIYLAALTIGLYADNSESEYYNNNDVLANATEYINKALILDPQSAIGLTINTQMEFHNKKNLKKCLLQKKSLQFKCW
tara:strand:+ start:250 stop:555 length:306 start_codon:yes stop_codon:yes gene_type:complete